MERVLGRSGIKVSALGMGCWAIGGFTRSSVSDGSGQWGWGEVDDEESVRTVQAAIAAGVNFFDTADIYGAGHSEEVLGRALAGQRQKVVIATKFGYTFDPYTRHMLGFDASPQYIRRAVEGSLVRLKTDYIDLYQLHRGEYDPRYLDDVCDVLERLVETGKIRHYGWCTWPGNTEGAKVFAGRKGCTAIQYRLNVLEDAPDMLNLCEDNELASISLAPLAMSLLTGKYNAESKFPENDVRHGWDLTGGQQAKQLKQLEQLREVLTSEGRTVAQGALAWIWARNGNTVPIPGARTVKQIEENAASMRFGPLNESQMEQIARIMGRCE
jgi:aryl-alcohol dehydrogenase-like predicted oxidoreductase